jgi:hypothetical protein
MTSEAAGPSPSLCLQTSELNDAEASCVRDCVGAASSIEFVEKRTDMKLGRVDRNSEATSDRFVRRAFGRPCCNEAWEAGF